MARLNSSVRSRDLRTAGRVHDDGGMRIRVATGLMIVALAAAIVPVAVAQAASSQPAAGRAVSGRAVSGQAGSGRAGASPAARAAQIAVLTAALAKMRAHYRGLQSYSPGVADIYDYGIGALWRDGIDGAGTTIAVLEGWNDPGVASVVRQFDQPLGLPDPVIRTIYPAGPLPKTCPAGMAKLGSYGDCQGWQGELDLDVVSAHLIAPYAKILIVVTPADTQIQDDAASQVAPPEMMAAVEDIASHHLANVISISDGTGESTYSHGNEEITAQSPAELAAAAQGIPVVAGTGDCGVVQNLAVANGQCQDTTTKPATATWDDSPWVTAVSGSVPDLSVTGKRAGSDPVWSDGVFAGGAGFSSVFTRPWYQDAVVPGTMREVPDITMDASQGTSEATPLFAGVLALATQRNKGANVGPVNPALYLALGPAGARDGIADVVRGSDSVTTQSAGLQRGYRAGPGFDIATGWGTVYAPRFVTSLVANVGLDVAARQRARDQLAVLEHTSITLTRTSAGYSVDATGFLPGHPVQVLVNGTRIAVVRADAAGEVSTAVQASTGTLTLHGMLITETAALSR